MEHGTDVEFGTVELEQLEMEGVQTSNDGGSLISIRLGNFLGFEFLVRNEEIVHHSHEERGIIEEFVNHIFTISFYNYVPT